VTRSGPPLVSVIVCTYNRHERLRRALESVLRQDCQDFEAIVVDDGSAPPVELPVDLWDRVRLLRIDHGGVGAARAAGLTAAQGSFVAYCDDDDEWTSEHLRTLLTYLLDHPDVDLVYADSAWVEDGAPPSVPCSFDFDLFHLAGENYIFATDVMHRTRSARDVCGFDPSLHAHEDWDLWLRMSRGHVFHHLPAVLATHYWHAGCVSATDHWDEWLRVYRKGVVPFDRRTWQGSRRELIWASMVDPLLSFTTVSWYLAGALQRLGVDIIVVPSWSDAPRELERFFKRRENRRLGFYYDSRLRPGLLKCERLIIGSMWESTLVPEEHVEEINRAATLLYVPCQQNLESYQDCGVRVRIKICHLGVDPEQFPYLTRSRQEFFTFGSFGDFSPRKGIDVLVRAFQDEFSPGEPVRLLLKNTGRREPPPYAAGDPRVTLLTEFMDQGRLLQLLRQMDAFVLPSRGEGFGLCGLEAMATGLPLIATNWSGPTEFLDPADSWPLSYRVVDAGGIGSNGTHYFGQWAEPDYEHLRFLMRWLFEHPEEAAEKGRLAAERVHARWIWDRPAREMLDDLDAIASQ
jgi:glycosyltransferase involved in cell wall biosynthesis